MEFFPISKLFENPGLHHLVEYILSNVDIRCLLRCRELTKAWRDFIDNSQALQLPIKELKFLAGTQRYKKLLSYFKEWRDVFELIKKSDPSKAKESIRILNTYHKEETGFKHELHSLDESFKATYKNCKFPGS